MTLSILHDMVDPDDPQGRTYRQVNAEKTHTIPVGALVEITGDENDAGMRLIVVYQGRDCDQEPLYWLTSQPDDLENAIERAESKDFHQRMKWTGGYGEESLKVIKLPEAGFIEPSILKAANTLGRNFKRMLMKMLGGRRMSIISDICAEHDRKIVQQAIKKAKDSILPLCQTAHAKDKVEAALLIVSEYCEEHIQE